MDESDCAGSEQCSDGLDNDGDRLFDCEDDDCAEACGTSCALPEGIPDVGTIHGALVGHASELSSRCSNTGSEPEVVYTVTASRTGVLELGVFGSELKLVSVRTSCDDGSTELDCSGTGELEVPVAEGQSYFVVVEGNVSDLLGEFDLSLNVREIACGNLAREGTEGCDDGNLLDGDGCDANCQVELSEQESNRSPRRANPYVSPFFGTISSALDQDYVSFELAEPPVAIYLNIADFGDGACDSGELDSLLTLIGPDGATTIAEDDDGGVGYCSEIEYVPEAPEAGPYFAAVGASPLASSFEFPYILSIYVELCGNGITSGDEQCDDGNQDSQDGCSSTCQLEE
jgi:cysteine-rich repeat protein